MATIKKQAAPKVIHSVVKTVLGGSIPVSIIPVARSGRPDFKFTTTYPVTSALMVDLAAHAARVEAEWSKPAPKQPRYWSAR